MRFQVDDIVRVEVDEIARRGISLVPADRSTFTMLSVHENLQIARRRHAPWTILEHVSPRLQRHGSGRTPFHGTSLVHRCHIMRDHA